MTDRDLQSAADIDDQLADWLMAHDCGLSEQEARDFDVWLGQSAAHRLAWAEVAPMWESFELPQKDEAFAAMLDDARSAARPPHRAFARSRRLFVGGGIALALTIAVIVAAPWHREQAAREVFAQQTYATGYRSESYRLADNTQLTLDAGSALAFSDHGNARVATLTRGRAYLDVHHDAARPFSITAEGATITDVGTRFGVSSQDGVLAVTLVSGKVTIMDPVTGTAAVSLVPGQQFERSGSAPGQVSSIDPGNALAWREGYVQFDRTPLSTAIAEINRYTAHPLQIGNPAINRFQISGRFKAGDPERFARVLALTYPVKLTTDAQGRATLDLKP